MSCIYELPQSDNSSIWDDSSYFQANIYAYIYISWKDKNLSLHSWSLQVIDVTNVKDKSNLKSQALSIQIQICILVTLLEKNNSYLPSNQTGFSTKISKLPDFFNIFFDKNILWGLSDNSVVGYLPHKEPI